MPSRVTRLALLLLCPLLLTSCDGGGSSGGFEGVWTGSIQYEAYGYQPAIHRIYNAVRRDTLDLRVNAGGTGLLAVHGRAQVIAALEGDPSVADTTEYAVREDYFITWTSVGHRLRVETDYSDIGEIIVTADGDVGMGENAARIDFLDFIEWSRRSPFTLRRR